MRGLWLWLWLGLWGSYPGAGAPVAQASAHGLATPAAAKSGDATGKAKTGKLGVSDLPLRRQRMRAVEN